MSIYSTPSPAAAKKPKRAYLTTVIRHKWFILVAGLKAKKIGKIGFWRLLIHDLSKFSLAEFRIYRKKFAGRNFTAQEWDRAWLHHIHRNPHHYEHWMIKGRPIPMPETHVREMVIDWMAAGKEYAGSWNIQEWLDSEVKVGKIILHPDTLVILKPILESQGFHWPK